MNLNNSLWKKLYRPRYRDAFIAANVGIQIASQLHELRTSRERSQDELAAEMRMNQSTISQMEKPEYRKYSIRTLIRFAQHYKVALDVRFVSLVDYVRRVSEETTGSLAPAAYGEASTTPRVPSPQLAQKVRPDQDEPLSQERLWPKPAKRDPQTGSDLTQIAVR
jgi:transcriptional regulator with XRE-family HTH domain